MLLPATHVRTTDRRYELKYLISDGCARALRGYARAFMRPDPHVHADRGGAYEVHSLYMDTPDLALCRATEAGLRNRYKLRIRVYGDEPDGPAFFEVKVRRDRVLYKLRAAVDRAIVPALLAGDPPRRTPVITGDVETIERFLAETRRIGARPSVIVSYVREAYVGSDDRFRLTFDRRLGAAEPLPGRRWDDGGDPYRVRMGGVILELKFTNRFPAWAAEMVQRFKLDRSPIPKYVTCVRALERPESRRARRAALARIGGC